MSGPEVEELTKERLCNAAMSFSREESSHKEPSLYGITDGKAVGTYLEHKFIAYLRDKFVFEEGNSASGIDLPGLEVDIKVTSERQPQSSSPFKSARQKIFGLGHHLIVFVYSKADDSVDQTGTLNIVHTVFVEKTRAADFQMTRGLRSIIENQGNEDDIVAFLQDRNLPVDEIEARNIAVDILAQPPQQGYLTISNALQWRLQYGRVLTEAGEVDGVVRVI